MELVNNVLAGKVFSQRTFKRYAIEALGQLVAYSQRVKLFSKLLNLRIDFYKDKNVGDLVSRIINGTTTVVDVFVLGLLNTIGDVVTLIGALAVMIMISPALTLTSIASISPMVVVIRVLGARMRSTYRGVRMRIGVLTSIVEESFFGVEAIKVFNREKSFAEYFAKESLATTKRAVQAALLGGMFWSSVGFISTPSTVSIIVVGGYLVTTGITSVGIVVAFTQYVARFTGPINNIAGLYDRLQLALASLERIYNVLDSEDVELDEGVEVERLRGEIVFENVWFEYVKGRPVLKNVSFRVSPGEVVAIVGRFSVDGGSSPFIFTDFHGSPPSTSQRSPRAPSPQKLTTSRLVVHHPTGLGNSGSLTKLINNSNL
jgi:ATP-binding cassette subfamily B protein